MSIVIGLVVEMSKLILKKLSILVTVTVAIFSMALVDVAKAQERGHPRKHGESAPMIDRDLAAKFVTNLELGFQKESKGKVTKNDLQQLIRIAFRALRTMSMEEFDNLKKKSVAEQAKTLIDKWRR